MVSAKWSNAERMIRRVRMRAVWLACALLVLVPPGVAYAESFNYVDGAFFGAYGYGETSGTASRQYNKVWRPVGTQFTLYFYTSSTYTSWSNTWSNPYTTPDGSGGSAAYAGCQNDTPSSVSPVTCQTTRP